MNIYHVVNFYEAKNPEDKKRNDYAIKSWQKLYAKGVIPVHLYDSVFERSSKDLGDTRKVPYVHDVIEEAKGYIKDELHMKIHGKNDTIMITNMDTILHEKIIETIWKKPMFYGSRRELEEDKKRLLTEEQISKLVVAHESSADAFAFPVQWWNIHKCKYPDMLLGCQWWDSVLIDLMEATKQNKKEDIRVTDHIYHRNHKPFWFSPETMFKNPGQKHNRDLANSWVNPNKNTKFADVKAWERKLEAEFNSTIGKNYVKAGSTTFVF